MKKGFFLTLDTAVALIIVTIIIGYSLYDIDKRDTTPWTEKRMLNHANDIVIMLKNTYTLQTLDETSIEDQLNTFLRHRSKDTKTLTV